MSAFGFLVSDRSGGIFQLALADGGSLTVLAQPSGGPATGGQGVLIFPNIAALEAFDVSAAPTPNGALAVVLSNNSLWELQAFASERAVDNITVASVTGGSPTQRWWRANVSLALPEYLAQTDWYISSAGNDEASGLGPGSALKTNAEVYRRWGYTWSPNLKGSGTFTIHHLTASTDGSDPTFYAPQLENGATFAQVAPLPAPSFTGTLLAVTPKARATNQALESTFTTMTGAITSGMVLVNTDRGNSRAMAVTDLGGGNWLLTQPLTPYAGGFPSSTEVDTWTNGDHIQGFAMIQVDIAHAGGQAATLDGSFDPTHLIQDIAIVDSNANGGAFVMASTFGALEDCPIGRSFQQDTGTTSFVAENCGFQVGAQGLMVASQFAGGFIGSPGGTSNLSGSLQGSSLLTLDVVILGTMALENVPIGNVYVHTAATVVVSGMLAFGNVLYGPGTMNAQNGGFISQDTAANTCPIATKQLNGVATGYSRATSGGVTTIHGGIALTTANLDAAAGPAGFGGYAEGGGAFISLDAGVQP